MAFSMMWGTGFGPGSTAVCGLNDYSGAEISGSYAHTGDYGIRTSSSQFQSARWVRAETTGSPSDLYIGVWVKYGSSYNRIYIDLADGSTLSLRPDGNGYWDLYVDGSLVAEGTTEIDTSYWHHVQIHVQISDTGQVDTKIEGFDDISYSGDTKPGSSSVIEFVRLYCSGGGGDAYWDDWVFGTGGWPGDIRMEPLTLNGDTATINWDGSDGDQVDNYALLDEQGPNDNDYVESVTTGDQDKYTLEDFDITNKDPIAVILWVRAKKDEADTHQIKLILDDGTTEDIGSAIDLLTSYLYLHRIDETAPSGGSWTDALLDALQVGIESVVV